MTTGVRCAAGQLSGDLSLGHCVPAAEWTMKRLQGIRSRRDRKPEGGAHDASCGLGCGRALITGRAKARPVLVSALLSALLLCPPAAAEGPPQVAVPSGQAVTLADLIWEGPNLVLRALAPEIDRETGSLDFAGAVDDLDALCSGTALPLARASGTEPAQIVVVLMDRPVPRGQAMPEATQLIGVYRIEDDRCIWEEF